MAYSTSLLKDRIEILNQSAFVETPFGKKAGDWVVAATIWAGVDWVRGVTAMRQGTLDSYDVIMVRCRYTPVFTRDSRIRYKDKVYRIESGFHADKQANTIQAVCVELTNQNN